MTQDLENAQVRDNTEAARFELHLAGTVAVAEYHLGADGIEFHHTEVPAELEGRGIASRLAKTALESARARGLAVTPTCAFFAEYIRRHPEYHGLVPDSDRRRLGIGIAPQDA